MPTCQGQEICGRAAVRNIHFKILEYLGMLRKLCWYLIWGRTATVNKYLLYRTDGLQGQGSSQRLRQMLRARCMAIVSLRRPEIGLRIRGRDRAFPFPAGLV